jgi:DmsE family decaheme c-type cytochrome
MKHSVVLLTMLLAYALPGPASAAQPEPAATEPAETASASTGARECTECHDESDVTVYAHHSDCLSCHTDAAAHSKASRKVLPGKTITSEACLSCHATGKGHAKDAKRMNFAFSEHNKAGVLCSDCHGIHGPKMGREANVGDLKMDRNSRLCVTCHQDVLARFSMPSHHPLKEGAVSCTSCHNQHDSKQTTLAGKTELCTTCHQAVRGPHVFEHPPAVEDCSNCHNPHGTPNRRLLEVAQPMQCLQCHSVAGNRHGQPAGTANAAVSNTSLISGAVLRNCSSCHGAIHGSSTDQHLRH